jgi:transcription elongation factor Elf1
MSCPKCGNIELYSCGLLKTTPIYGDDPAGIVRCGKCGNIFPEAESKDLEFKNQILEELKKISKRVDEIESRLPSIRLGGCPNCGSGEFGADGQDEPGMVRCMFCGYRFEGPKK